MSPLCQMTSQRCFDVILTLILHHLIAVTYHVLTHNFSAWKKTRFLSSCRPQFHHFSELACASNFSLQVFLNPWFSVRGHPDRQSVIFKYLSAEHFTEESGNMQTFKYPDYRLVITQISKTEAQRNVAHGTVVVADKHFVVIIDFFLLRGMGLGKTSVKTYFTTGLCAHNWNLMKNLLGLILILIS